MIIVIIIKGNRFLQLHGMYKIPQKYAYLLSAALMSIFMATIMTCIVTAINLGGFPADFVQRWLTALSRVILIVFPIILFLRPLVERIVKLLTA